MDRKGFTLVEVLVGLCLLGVISVTILPIISSSMMALSKNSIRMEMNYMGETVMERIKAFNVESTSQLYIYDTDIAEIIDLFRSNGKIELILPKKDEKFLIKLVKDQRSYGLWQIIVYVYHDKDGSNINHVEYKMYLPSK